MTTEEDSRAKVKQAIDATRRGLWARPQDTVISRPTTSNFESARENSIEIYDDNKLVRNSIMTRSARRRKFKFYQYKPIQDNVINVTPRLDEHGVAESEHKLSNEKDEVPQIMPYRSNGLIDAHNSSAEPAILLPREDVIQCKIPLGPEQSQELIELDNQIADIEKCIAKLNQGDRTVKGNIDALDEKFELVNKKNDLLRRQMQLNIIEQERALEKASDDLKKELSSLCAIDDSRKTQAQMERQQYLYNQLKVLVDKRNELVLHLDYQEREIEQDNAVKAKLKSVISNELNRHGQKDNHSQNDQNCIIQ